MSNLQEFKLIIRAIETLRTRIVDLGREERSFNTPSLQNFNAGHIERAHIEIMRLHQCLETSVKVYIENEPKQAKIA